MLINTVEYEVLLYLLESGKYHSELGRRCDLRLCFYNHYAVELYEEDFSLDRRGIVWNLLDTYPYVVAVLFIVYSSFMTNTTEVLTASILGVALPPLVYSVL